MERGELLAISYQDVKTLYFQSPAFAFYLLRLVSERLFSNLQARARRRAFAGLRTFSPGAPRLVAGWGQPAAGGPGRDQDGLSVAPVTIRLRS